MAITTINYQFGDDQRSFDFDLPVKLYLRLDWNTRDIAFAALSQNEWLNDPSDMYHYETYTCTTDKITSFVLYMRHCEWIEEFSDQYDEIITVYAPAETLVDEADAITYGSVYVGLPEAVQEPSE